jgi:hypothetical protein
MKVRVTLTATREFEATPSWLDEGVPFTFENIKATEIEAVLADPLLFVDDSQINLSVSVENLDAPSNQSPNASSN